MKIKIEPLFNILKFPNKILFFLVLPISFFIPKLTTVLFLIIFFSIVKNIKKIEIDVNNIYFFLIFSILILISSFWSINFYYTVTQSIKIIFSLLCGFVFIDYKNKTSYLTAQETIHFFVIGFFVSCFLCVFERVFFFPFSYIFESVPERLFTPVSLLISLYVWPIIFNFRQNKILIVSVLTISFIALLMKYSDTAILSLICGFLVFIFSLKYAFFVFISFGVFLFIYSLFLPSLILHFFTEYNIKYVNQYLHEGSYLERGYIGKFFSEIIAETPLLGNGFRTSRLLSDPNSPLVWEYTPYKGDRYDIYVNPVHAHNIVLEIWTELGIVGIFFFLYFMFYILCTVYKNFKGFERSCILAFITSILVIDSLSLSIWQNWWILSIFFAIGIFKHMNYNKKQ